MSRHDLIVFSVIRNGIQNGYPFVEAYGSWLNYCDQVFVLDGHSTDGTDIVLRYLSQISPKFVYERAPWPEDNIGGSAIAKFTNRCLEMVRDKCDRLVYIQADEIFEPKSREKLGQWTQGAVEFTRYILFWNSFYQVYIHIGDPTQRQSYIPWNSIRLFPSDCHAYSIGDGLTFEIEGTLITQVDDMVFHYGWNFPVNILQKMMSHKNLYSDNPEYNQWANRAAKLLANRAFAINDLRTLDYQRASLCRPYTHKHPNCIQHLLTQNSYDPYVGLSLLWQGIRW